MEKNQTIQTEVSFKDPVVQPHMEAKSGGGVADSYSIEVQGIGQLTGLSYTIPAHGQGRIQERLRIASMSNEDIQRLNDLALGMLDKSKSEEIKAFERTSQSANLSIWIWFFGSGRASSSSAETRERMKANGLSDAQITLLMNAFLETAKRMTTVNIDFYVNNLENGHPVSGDLYLYTISGTIVTENGSSQYRMLSDRAFAGGPPPSGGGAPSSVCFNK